jgi:small subunit ribosomal protein S16
MVKIRLRRIGAKGRPFYRVVVAESTSGRNGAFVETIGTYDPVAQPKQMEINEERALHWLMEGAEPTETTAYLLNKLGILPKFLEQRPAHKKKYAFLDKRTAAISVAAAAPAENA